MPSKSEWGREYQEGSSCCPTSRRANKMFISTPSSFADDIHDPGPSWENWTVMAERENRSSIAQPQPPGLDHRAKADLCGTQSADRLTQRHTAAPLGFE